MISVRAPRTIATLLVVALLSLFPLTLVTTAHAAAAKAKPPPCPGSAHTSQDGDTCPLPSGADEELLAAALAALAAAAAAVIAKCIADGKCDPGWSTRYKHKSHVHHIVAQGAAAAQPARDILGFVGISVQNPVNLVRLKTVFHQRLHTPDYYNSVNVTMTAAYNQGVYGKVSPRKRVVRALNKLRIALLAQNARIPAG